MSFRDISLLVHPLNVLAERHHSLVEARGIDMFFTCTRRSLNEQEAVYAQGRRSLNQVNKLRLNAGLCKITGRDNVVVSNAPAGSSFHNYDAAYDVGILDNGKYVTSAEHPSWDIVCSIGREIGLVCGADWLGKKRDVPHFQLAGVTLDQLRAGFIRI